MIFVSEKLRPPKPIEDPREEYRWRYRVFELLNGIQTILASSVEMSPAPVGQLAGVTLQEVMGQIDVILLALQQNLATTVAPEDTFGLPDDAGTSTVFAREDHTHGTPVDPLGTSVFTDHSTRHENGGADEISIAGLSGEAADLQPPKVAGSDGNVQYNNGGVIGGAASIRYDDGATTTRLGGASHYSEVEADGTLKFVGDATVFNDINVSGTSLGVGVAAPSIVDVASTTIKAYAFIGTGPNADELHGSIEILHDYKEGSNIVAHVHWMPATNDAGNVKWQLEYVWINGSGVAGSSTTIDVTTAAGGTAWTEKRSSFTTISGAGKTIGSRFMFRIFRNPADAADTYGFNAVLLDIGVHYEIDTVGSRAVTTK